MILDSKKLKRKMDENLYTVKELAKVTKISPNTIVRARNNENITPSTLKKICDALKCNPVDLLPDEE